MQLLRWLCKALQALPIVTGSSFRFDPFVQSTKGNAWSDVILSCGNSNRTSQNFGSSSISKPSEMLQRPVTNKFTIPGDGILQRRVSELPQFVTVRGVACSFSQVCALYGILQKPNRSTINSNWKSEQFVRPHENDFTRGVHRWSPQVRR